MSPNAIDYFSLGHPLRQTASRVSLRVRQRIFRRFIETMNPGPSSLVLDVGATPDRSLPESNYFERFYPHRSRLVVTGIEDASFLRRQYPGLSFVITEDLALPFGDGKFDVVFCSAVLEHVGNRVRQAQFVAELLRVAKRFFVVTPNRLFPIEFHTIMPLLHWLPAPTHRRLLRLLGMEFWSRPENLNLLDAKTLLKLFGAAHNVRLARQRLLGLTSNLIAYGDSRPL